MGLEFGAEPVNDGDADANSNLTVDFGLVYNFDLALRKTLAAGQANPVQRNATVRFTIEVYNQGTVAARNIVVSDTLPAGLQLADPDWTAGSGNLATRTIAGPLAPGASTAVTLTVRVLNTALAGELRNVAEISSAQDNQGQPVPSILDRDSDPDGDAGNDPEVDDEIGNAGGDEDDADPAVVILAAEPIPTLGGGALWLLALGRLLQMFRDTTPELLPLAMKAERVFIRGRTDSTGTVAGNRALAIARAATVRAAFASGGVDPRKLKVSYCVTCFVASNDTEAGRSANRRVEVELVMPSVTK